MDDQTEKSFPTAYAVVGVAAVAAGAYVAQNVYSKRKKFRQIKACAQNASRHISEMTRRPGVTPRDITNAFNEEMEFLMIVKNYQTK